LEKQIIERNKEEKPDQNQSKINKTNQNKNKLLV